MRQAGEKDMLSYLAALSLTLSIVESALPHSLPFLRLGLANMALLWALVRLGVADYLKLLGLKWFLSALVSGVLLSPYALVSLAGTVSSGLVMLIVYKGIGKWTSMYSISALGAAASGAMQLMASTLFLTDAVLDLMPLMLLFSTVSGLVVAFIHYRMEIPGSVVVEKSIGKGNVSYRVVVPALLGLVAVMFIDSIPLLVLAFIISLAICRLSGRRIKAVYYIVSIISVVAFNLLVPSGRVLWLFVTEDALIQGLVSALRLATLVALSQSLATMPLEGLGIISDTMSVHASLSSRFFTSEGKFKERLVGTLAIDHFTPVKRKREDSRTGLMALLSLSLVLISIGQYLFF